LITKFLNIFTGVVLILMTSVSIWYTSFCNANVVGSNPSRTRFIILLFTSGITIAWDSVENDEEGDSDLFYVVEDQHLIAEQTRRQSHVQWRMSSLPDTCSNQVPDCRISCSPTAFAALARCLASYISLLFIILCTISPALTCWNSCSATSWYIPSSFAAVYGSYVSGMNDVGPW